MVFNDGNINGYRAVFHNDVMILEPFISDLGHHKRRAIGIVPVNNPDGQGQDDNWCLKRNDADVKVDIVDDIEVIHVDVVYDIDVINVDVFDDIEVIRPVDSPSAHIRRIVLGSDEGILHKRHQTC